MSVTCNFTIENGYIRFNDDVTGKLEIVPIMGADPFARLTGGEMLFGGSSDKMKAYGKLVADLVRLKLVRRELDRTKDVQEEARLNRVLERLKTDFKAEKSRVINMMIRRDDGGVFIKASPPTALGLLGINRTGDYNRTR